MEVTVYILRCRDGSYYTGLTKQSIEARLWEHNAGVYDGYTARRRPVELVFMEAYDRILDAIARERQIKGWNRQKKEALIAYAYEALPDLSHRGPVRSGGQVSEGPISSSRGRE
ncbi:GIY-YIG nuclease family protein [Ciceribacter selenitireducens]